MGLLTQLTFRFSPDVRVRDSKMPVYNDNVRIVSDRDPQQICLSFSSKMFCPSHQKCIVFFIKSVLSFSPKTCCACRQRRVFSINSFNNFFLRRLVFLVKGRFVFLTKYSASFIPCGEFGSPSLGKATAAARTARPIPA